MAEITKFRGWPLVASWTPFVDQVAPQQSLKDTEHEGTTPAGWWLVAPSRKYAWQMETIIPKDV